eukprot:TRINITY_DN20197_c0_g1_i1.p1 TRINITY_DN20197_c0_g1~~TRINITY_DN20197_c0_g1_i1.p1  ORF type:complete len:129 (+),score=6.52 TRINITY_DN20197_c0_g1_i1:62-448(+)
MWDVLHFYALGPYRESGCDVPFWEYHPIGRRRCWIDDGRCVEESTEVLGSYEAEDFTQAILLFLHGMRGHHSRPLPGAAGSLTTSYVESLGVYHEAKLSWAPCESAQAGDVADKLLEPKRHSVFSRSK